MRLQPRRRVMQSLKSIIVVAAMGGTALHCTDKPKPAPAPSAQTRCDGTFSSRDTRIDVTNPQPLSEVPGDQTFCDFHTFAWNNFLYLTQAVTDPDDSRVSTPRFLSYAPFYNMLRDDGAPAPIPFPGGSTMLQAGRLDQKQAGAGMDVLVDVADEEVVYDIRFNKAMYDFVVGNGYYTKQGYDALCGTNADAGPFTPCPNETQLWLPWGDDKSMGAVEVKSAWRQFPENDCPESQMYCAGKNLGLVGMHIVQKTLTHGEWVWASFEHVANAPDCAPGFGSPISPLSPLGVGWSFFDPAKAPDGVMQSKRCGVTVDSPQCNLNPGDGGSFKQVNICRTDALPAGGANEANCAVVEQSDSDPQANSGGNVACLNATLQPRRDGVWKNYFLIGTLWTQGTQDPDKHFTIDLFQAPRPPALAKTAVGFPHLANTAMESFLQKGATAYDPNVQLGLPNETKAGCFGCHNTEASNSNANLSHFPTKFNDLNKERVPVRR
ncbi:MAG TPA: hypothetical protein VE153_25940 [Myxococcus sp.]|nr:hypothetical protein [Myxococcus sp.]